MDESWRMQMGMGILSTSAKPRLSLPRRRSTEETPSRHSGTETLDPEDFSDVFGGPPRSVLRRQFSGDADFFRPAATSFYEEIFRIPETLIPMRSGVGSSSSRRRLPEFRIPTCSRIERSDDGFYGDIFGKEDEIRRSRSRSLSKSHSKSKSNCSSVLSSDDLSPLRPAIPEDDDVSFSIFASKLRPINVPPSRWNSTARIPEEPLWQQHGSPALSSNYYYYPSFYNHQIEQGLYTDSFRSLRNSIPRRVTSPETISLDPNSHVSFKVSIDDLELNSPSSVVSSQFQEFDQPKTEKMTNQQQELDQDYDDDEDEDDEVMSSYVIEINSDHREGTEEAIAIDEAIAWAKEKFQSASPNRNTNMEEHDKNEPVTANGNNEYINLSSPERELQVLDNDIKEWSAGKETNIRQLLSTLHNILWENSGWQEISIANLMENSKVKKGYQKARLCLHPDKVQQRGSTLTQKYIAEQTFAILQEAWDAFISQDSI